MEAKSQCERRIGHAGRRLRLQQFKRCGVAQDIRDAERLRHRQTHRRAVNPIDRRGEEFPDLHRGLPVFVEDEVDLLDVQRFREKRFEREEQTARELRIEIRLRFTGEDRLRLCRRVEFVSDVTCGAWSSVAAISSRDIDGSDERSVLRRSTRPVMASVIWLPPVLVVALTSSVGKSPAVCENSTTPRSIRNTEHRNTVTCPRVELKLPSSVGARKLPPTTTAPAAVRSIAPPLTRTRLPAVAFTFKSTGRKHEARRASRPRSARSTRGWKLPP